MTSTSLPDLAVGVDHVDALPVGTRLGEFEIMALLGVGGFGMVYKAFDHSLRRQVAIKEYMPAALAGRSSGLQLSVRTSVDAQSFQAGLSSFVDEARLLARFDHPSLVKVFRFWEANNTAYMVMPLYQGITLKQARLQMRKPPSEAWLRKVLWAVLDALRVLHEHDTLHRDISPDNIFLQDVGPPVLLDLGAARHAITDTQRQLTAILKVNYAPIEQYAHGGSADGEPPLAQGPWSDLYALAAVVHGCVCNDMPLPASLRAIRDRMVRFSRVGKTVKRQFGVEYSEPFCTAITQSLELQPEQRPQSIDAFLALMDMHSAPPGLAQFNWRQELGSSWAPSEEALASEQELDSEAELPTRFLDAPADLAALDLDLTAAAPAAAGATPIPSVRAVTQAPAPAPQGFVAEPVPAPRPRIDRRVQRRQRLLMLVLLGSVLLAAALWWWSRSAAPALAPPVPAPEVVAAPAPASAAEEPEEVVEFVETPVEPASAPVAAAPASTSAQAPVAARPRRNAPQRAAPEPAAPLPAPAPVVAAPSPPAPEPKPTPVRNPEDACADANFIARPMCLYNECQKPGLARHPVCVAQRKHYEAEAERRRLSP
ncbi:serine/threonine protein kinase [Acidovorax sp. HDW3]|uniref:serine/threonine protein kinase n=1 Tax=Acidovorax sp. HDW3 TaxID=2714923 RepID=UPI0014094DFD|nr:serine/threonine-protein kinase [Acidovorax sp. HDW3]QIL43036.1 serine/threonine protein kinase [Acidovorax sp. HDW3]